MAIPELARRRAERLLQQLIERRISPRILHEVRLSLEVRGNNVTIFEHRPVWRIPDKWTNGKTAQFRYDPTSGLWTLFWSDRHGRWLHYDGAHPAADIAVLIRELDEDPAGAFWG